MEGVSSVQHRENTQLIQFLQIFRCQCQCLGISAS